MDKLKIFCPVKMKLWTKINYFVHSESQTGQKFDMLSTSDETLDKV